MIKPSRAPTASERPEASGLGTLLRHLVDLLDRGSEAHYRDSGLDMRARYTPLLRALGERPLTVSELCARASVTQGAVSQAIKLMEADGLVWRIPGDDGRSRAAGLTRKGTNLRARLVPQWEARLRAVDELENEIHAKLREILLRAIEALQREGFEHRIAKAETREGRAVQAKQKRS
jgi:DNA-binding MarR family transcriptional regulator